MEVKEGYKQTEVGIIPKNWDTPMLGDLFTFKNGLNKAKVFFGYGTPIVNYMDVYGRRGIFSHDLQGRVSLSREEIKAFEVQKGDVFFTRTSETVEEVGITSVMLDEPCDTVFSGFVLRARPKDDTLDDQFKKYCFSTSAVRKQVVSQSTETTRALTNGRCLSIVMIARPPKAEQAAIATALSDADALISSLEKLIAKKQNIKQGTMQLLLAGKKRLPGFTREWGEKTLKEIVSQFIVPMRDKPKVFRGNIPWCRIEDFDGKYLSDSKSNQYVDQEIINSMNLKIHPKETVLVSCSADLGRCAIAEAPLISNQTFIGLMFDDHVADNEFFYYYMTFHSKELNNLSSGTTILYLAREQFENFKVIIPPSKEEQTAIAQVLSDMDSEIEAIERKLEKYHLIKQGMMQELLTGKKRLI